METRLTALYNLGQKLILLRDANQIAEAVLEIAARVLECPDSDFFLLDKTKNDLYVAARRGQLEEAKHPRLSLDGDKGITVLAAQSGQTIYVPDVRGDPRYVYTGFDAVSELAVPVQIEGRILGVLNVESAQADAFSETDQELLQILATQAALALENARLHAKEHRRVEEAAALNKLARRVSASLDLQATLDAVVAAAAELIPCVLAEISLWDEKTQRLILRALRAEPSRSWPLGTSYPLGQGYTGWLVRHKKPLLVPDVEARRDIRPHLLSGELPYQAYAGVPLLMGQELIGILVLIADKVGAFSEEHIELLQVLAAQAAVAIRNARLYEETARRHRELAALYAVAATVNRTGDLEHILAEGLKQATAVTGLELGIIGLRDSSIGDLGVVCHQGLSPEHVVLCRERLWKNWPETWPEELGVKVTEVMLGSADIPSWWKDEGIQLVVDIPLFTEGQHRGMLCMATRQSRTFTEQEKSLLQAIGHQLGTAIANARLREEALTAERLAAVGRVATSVAHDLRSPLGGILRSAEFLARPELSPSTRQKLSQSVISLARRLINTTQGILDYVRRERLPLRRAPCVLSAFMDEVLGVLEVDFSDRGIEVVRDCNYEGPMVMDADRMAQVVYNIAVNARDVMPRGGTFTVVTRKIGDCVELRFSDTGPGIPEELGDRIFEPFFTHGKREGAGLGLSIARRIVEEHGGELRVESYEEQGATFVVSLPLR